MGRTLLKILLDSSENRLKTFQMYIQNYCEFPHKTGELEGTSGLSHTASSPPNARIPSARSSNEWSFCFKGWFHSGLLYLKMKGLSLSCSLWVLNGQKWPLSQGEEVITDLPPIPYLCPQGGTSRRIG